MYVDIPYRLTRWCRHTPTNRQLYALPSLWWVHTPYQSTTSCSISWCPRLTSWSSVIMVIESDSISIYLNMLCLHHGAVTYHTDTQCQCHALSTWWCNHTPFRSTRSCSVSIVAQSRTISIRKVLLCLHHGAVTPYRSTRSCSVYMMMQSHIIPILKAMLCLHDDTFTHHLIFIQFMVSSNTIPKF